MAIYLEPKYIHIQHSTIYSCPNPQFNAECMGKFVHTRKWQKECVACMRLHETLERHPRLTKIVPPCEDKKKRFDILIDEIVFIITNS